MLKSKRRGKMRRGVLRCMITRYAHTSGVAMSATAECGYKSLPHQPYSAELA